MFEHLIFRFFDDLIIRLSDRPQGFQTLQTLTITTWSPQSARLQCPEIVGRRDPIGLPPMMSQYHCGSHRDRRSGPPPSPTAGRHSPARGHIPPLRGQGFSLLFHPMLNHTRLRSEAVVFAEEGWVISLSRGGFWALLVLGVTSWSGHDHGLRVQRGDAHVGRCRFTSLPSS